MSTEAQTHQWQTEPPQERSMSTGARITLAVAFLLFVAGGLLFGYLFYSVVSERFAQPLNPAPASVSVLPSSSGSGGAAGSTPAASETQQPAAAPTSKERINILLLGIDQRESEAGQPTRTDTMILLTIDPVGKTMGLLTIPRDLWVPIPGLSKEIEDRINTAHFYGDLYKYPGGGAALAKKAVQYNLGVPVHYYVRIDFKGFEKIVDALGGVTINVEKAIRDDQYPDDNYGMISIYIPAGLQHMDGETALRYVRTRHVDSDIGRMRRQVQFLTAMWDQALKVSIVTKLPGLISQFRDSVKTDLSASEIINLARIATQIERTSFVARSIDETMVLSWVTPQGAEVLVPKRDAIKQVVADIFGSAAATPTPAPQKAAASPTAASTPVQSAEVRARLVADNARIEVLNGTTKKGLAGRAQVFLNSLGYNVVTIGDAGRYDYTDSVIVYYTERPYTMNALAKQFGVKAENIRVASSARMDVDIRIILGSSATVP